MYYKIWNSTLWALIKNVNPGYYVLVMSRAGLNFGGNFQTLTSLCEVKGSWRTLEGISHITCKTAQTLSSGLTLELCHSEYYSDCIMQRKQAIGQNPVLSHLALRTKWYLVPLLGGHLSLMLLIMFVSNENFLHYVWCILENKKKTVILLE